VISKLQAPLHEAPEYRVQLVDAMLKQQVGFTVGRLVMWVQQQPEQQLSDFRAAAVAAHQGSTQVTCASGGTTASIWGAGMHLLKLLAGIAALESMESAGERSLAANATQQLDQSGKACSKALATANALRVYCRCRRDSPCIQFCKHQTEHLEADL
jgi:hypothetical protein